MIPLASAGHGGAGHRVGAGQGRRAASTLDCESGHLLDRGLATQCIVRRTISHHLYSSPMTKVEKLEREIRSLTAKELATFREWFTSFDAAAWDAQLEADAQAGKLEALADDALADHRAGRPRKLCITTQHPAAA